MKLSIISPVLDSHEVVRRQILHYERMELPDDIEIIFVDDGSNPPLATDENLKNFSIHPTLNAHPWTEHIARNEGVMLAKGGYVAIVDIDYILPEETIQYIRMFSGDKMNFVRRFGILNENGELVYDRNILERWGLKKKWLRRNSVPGHRNQFVMRRELFMDLGGYREDLYGVAHPKGGGAGQKFYMVWQKAEEEGKVVTYTERPDIFMFPGGKYCEDGDLNYDPFDLFHNLLRPIVDSSRKTNKQKRREAG